MNNGDRIQRVFDPADFDDPMVFALAVQTEMLLFGSVHIVGDPDIARSLETKETRRNSGVCWQPHQETMTE